MYKSHTIHVPSGEPPESTSRPPAKRKPGVVRPITAGKLLKAGGPSQKSKSASRPKPAAQPLPGQSVTSQSTRPMPVAIPASTVRQPPKRNSMLPPPPPPPPPPAEPEVPLYKAKFAFEGQEGEMSLVKDQLYELVDKDDNGWWLIKNANGEGWAPYNYLELVPPKPKAAVAPPPPPNRRPPPTTPAVATMASGPTPAPAVVKSVVADSSAKPVSVFPGMGPSNGSATPWKKSLDTLSDNTPASSRPASSLAAKPPPIANKPKPPPVAAKPGVPPKPPAAKPAGGKPPTPSAPRPNAPPRPGGGTGKPGNPAAGQMDLAAAVSNLSFRYSSSTDNLDFSWQDVHKR